MSRLGEPYVPSLQAFRDLTRKYQTVPMAGAPRESKAGDPVVLVTQRPEPKGTVPDRSIGPLATS